MIAVAAEVDDLGVVDFIEDGPDLVLRQEERK
jgi:hypothetical protein